MNSDIKNRRRNQKRRNRKLQGTVVIGVVIHQNVGDGFINDAENNQAHGNGHENQSRQRKQIIESIFGVGMIGHMIFKLRV